MNLQAQALVLLEVNHVSRRNRLTGPARYVHHQQMNRAHKKVARPIRKRGVHRFDRQGSDLVQMRPAWADSVLLYWGSSVAYEDSGLDRDLTAELEAWDARYYDRVRPDGRWRSQASHDAHQTEGVRLAQRVADALGRAFAVEFDERIVRSRHRPATLAAAAAFTAHGNRREAELHSIMEQSAHESSREDNTAPNRTPATQPGQWLREVRSETTKRVRVRLSPDLSVGIPVEVVVNGQPGYVDGHMLGISASLTRDLEDFQEWWEQHSWDDDEQDDDDEAAPEDPAWASWRQQGSRLVERLQAELGDDYYVTWA
jgi:hypothetical protein